MPFDSLVFGYDWHNYWVMYQGGWPDYGRVDVYNPPWTVLMLWPVGALPFTLGWSVLASATIGVLILSVPRLPSGKADIGATLALLFTFWTLRQIAEGNLALLTIGGGVLVLSGWQAQSPWRVAAGLLLITAKYQEGWLLLIALGWSILRTWPARRWQTLAGLVLLVVAPSVLMLGADWLGNLLPASGGLQFSAKISRLPGNISLTALTGLPGPWPLLRPLAWLLVFGGTIYVAMKSGPGLSREKIGLLLTASMLLAPYTGGMSLVTALAMGGILVLQHSLPQGLVLLLAYNVVYISALPSLAPFLPSALSWVVYDRPDYFQMFTLLLTWLFLGWRVYRMEVTPRAGAPVEAAAH
jgi:hypothetical protein